MSNKMCVNCKYLKDGKYCNRKKSDIYNPKIFCGYWKQKPTVFERLTTSEEALAEKLVYPTYGVISRSWDFEKDDWGTAEPSWSSTVLPPDKCFSTKEDAIALTVAKLKEVYNETTSN